MKGGLQFFWEKKSVQTMKSTGKYPAQNDKSKGVFFVKLKVCSVQHLASLG